MFKLDASAIAFKIVNALSRFDALPVMTGQRTRIATITMGKMTPLNLCHVFIV
jgi:hypothetical protein